MIFAPEIVYKKSAAKACHKRYGGFAPTNQPRLIQYPQTHFSKEHAVHIPNAGWTGDPYVSCRQFTKDDLCNPNPCGENAQCTPGIDRRTGSDSGVCTCPAGYIGEPLIRCNRGEA